MNDESTEYVINLRVEIRSTLTKDEIKRMLIVALWEEDRDLIPDGSTDELEVVEYLEISVQEIV